MTRSEPFEANTASEEITAAISRSVARRSSDSVSSTPHGHDQLPTKEVSNLVDGFADISFSCNASSKTSNSSLHRSSNPSVQEVCNAVNSSEEHRATLAREQFSEGISHHEARRFSDACIAMEKAVMLQREACAARGHLTSDIDATSDRATLAQYLYRSSFSLQDAGRLPHALIVLHEAVAMQRQLVDLNSESHLPNLAEYLFGLGNALHAMQKFAQASENKREALKLMRELGPDRIVMNHALYVERTTTTEEETRLIHYRSTRAKHLNSLGVSLHDLGSFEAACAEKEKAIQLQQNLIRSSSEPEATIYRSALAHYLISLGTSLHGQHKFAKACNAKRKAVDIQRALLSTITSAPSTTDVEEDDAESTPKYLSPDHAILAKYLNTLGVSLHELGSNTSFFDKKTGHKSFTEACQMKREAMTLQRALFRSDRENEVYRAALAQYLHSLGTSKHALGSRHLSAACGYKREAVKLQEELCSLAMAPGSDEFCGVPPKYLKTRGMLAHYLNSCGTSLHAAGQIDEACEVKKQAVDIQRELSRSETRSSTGGSEQADLQEDDESHRRSTDIGPHRRALLAYLRSYRVSLYAAGAARRKETQEIERDIQRKEVSM